jgi:hypothetical protein
VVVPEWKIETGEEYESQSTDDSGIKQMSFRSASFKETDKKKTTNTAESEVQLRTKSKSDARPKSEKKSFWSRE